MACGTRRKSSFLSILPATISRCKELRQKVGRVYIFKGGLRDETSYYLLLTKVFLYQLKANERMMSLHIPNTRQCFMITILCGVYEINRVKTVNKLNDIENTQSYLPVV